MCPPTTARNHVPTAGMGSRRRRLSSVFTAFSLVCSSLGPVFGRIGAEFQQPRLLGMQLQVKLPKPFGQLRPEPFGIRLDLESRHGVVRNPENDDVAGGVLLAP